MEPLGQSGTLQHSFCNAAAIGESLVLVFASASSADSSNVRVEHDRGHCQCLCGALARDCGFQGMEAIDQHRRGQQRQCGQGCKVAMMWPAAPQQPETGG